MINYIKSELYRISHMKGLYILCIICAGLLFAMNLVLCVCGAGDSGFPYNNTSFAFNMAEGSAQIVFILTLCMGGIIFADEMKNRTMMNSIAFGFSRLQLYFGKMIVAVIGAVVCLTAVFAIFIGSAYLLLENSGIDALLSLLRCYGAESLLMVCGLLAAITLMFVIGNVGGATWSWLGIFMGIPVVSSMLGMKFKIFMDLYTWCAYTLTGLTVMDGEAEVMIYKTTEGLQKCLVAGALGTLLFIVIGVLCLRKKSFK